MFIIREADDTFIDADYTAYIHKDINETLEFYKNNIRDNTIYVDSRLITLISYMIVKFGDEVLIYDPYVAKVKTIYRFVGDYFKIAPYELTLDQIRRVFVLYILFMIHAKQLMFDWNIVTIIRNIKSHENIFDVIINYIGLQQQTEISNKNVFKVVNYFKEFYKNDDKWELSDVTYYEFYVALTILKNNNFII